MSNAGKGILATVGSLAVVAGISIGGWQLGWWMQNSATNHQAHILQHSYGAQSAYQEQLHQSITDIDGVEVQINDPNTPASEKAALRAQETAMVNQACDIASKVTITLPTDETAWVSTHCN